MISDERIIHEMLSAMPARERSVALVASVIEHDPDVFRQAVTLAIWAETLGKHLSERDRLELAALFIDAARTLVTTWH